MTCPLDGLHQLHQGSGRPLVAGFQHHLDHLTRAREYGLDAAVAPIADPAFQSMQLGLMLRPGAEAYALDASVDQHMGNSVCGHHPSIMRMAGISMTSRIIFIERPYDTLRILGVYPAQNLVDLGLHTIVTFLRLG